MKVKVNFPQKKALELGVAKWGYIGVGLQPILDQLAEDERVQLKVEDEYLKVRRFRDTYSDDYVTVEVQTATGEDAVDRIREQLAQNEVARQELVAHLDSLLEDVSQCLKFDGSRAYRYGKNDIAALAHKAGIDPAPYENAIQEAAFAQAIEWRAEWARFFETWQPNTEHSPTPRHLNGMISQTKYLTLERAAQVAEGFGFELVLGRIAARQKEIDAEKAAREAAKERSRAAWLGWATEHGTEALKRAIAEGYPLGNAVEDAVANSFFPRSGSTAISFYSKVYDKQLRRVPNQAAYTLQEYLQDRITGAKDQAPEGMTITVGKIYSVKVFVDSDCDHEVEVKRTAVPVVIDSPHFAVTRWYVLDE
jgi:hypothetical protein